MALRRSLFRHVAMTLIVVAIVVSIGLPAVSVAQAPAPQRVDFELGYQQGNPSFSGFSWPWQSPNLFTVIRQSGIDVDQLLATSGHDIDWLLTTIGKDTDFLLERSGMTADLLLDAAGESTEWLIGQSGNNADWMLQSSGKSITWLLDRTGGTADQLLDWAGKDADWLLDILDKDVDWILERSGKSKTNIVSWADKSNNWVAGIVKDVLCSNLGAGRSACNSGVDLVKDSLSQLMGKIDRSAEWWLDEVGEDADWLLGKAGKNSHWMLAEAGKTRTWLWNELGYDADWLLTKAGQSKSWLLTLMGHNVDWLLAQTNHSNSWLFAQLGGTADWLLTQTNRDADWILEQVGWRMQDAELVVSAILELQVVTGTGVELTYPGASQLQYLPGTPQTPRYARRIAVWQGSIKAVEGLGASNPSIAVTYTDPTGITASASGDAGMFNQDLAITIDDERRVYRAIRHADGWLVTMCIPLKEIITALLVELPPASAAALVLVPDIMMQVNGDVGYRLENEQLQPGMGPIAQFNLSQPQPYYEFVMGYGAQVYSDAKMNGGSWGFAWGLMCGPGVGISMGYQIPGGQTLVEAGPGTVSDQVLVRFPLATPSDMPKDTSPPTSPGAGTTPSPRPGTPGATPTPVPRPGTVGPQVTPDQGAGPAPVQPAPRPAPRPPPKPAPKPAQQQPAPKPQPATGPQPVPQPQPAAQRQDATLAVNALNDRPGPVTLRVLGSNASGATTVDTSMQWRADNNQYSTQSIRIPSSTNMIRLTFVNDYYRPGGPDTDRNAFIDFLVWNNQRIEAESFDETGGRPGDRYAGCGRRQETGRSSGFVADCGNGGDYVAFRGPGSRSRR